MEIVSSVLSGVSTECGCVHVGDVITKRLLTFLLCDDQDVGCVTEVLKLRYTRRSLMLNLCPIQSNQLSEQSTEIDLGNRFESQAGFSLSGHRTAIIACHGAMVSIFIAG